MLPTEVLMSEVEVMYLFVPHILPVGYTVNMPYPLFEFLAMDLGGLSHQSGQTILYRSRC